VGADAEAVGERCLADGASEVYVADNPTTCERVWKVRRNVAEAFKVLSPHQSLEDIVVPVAAIAKMAAALQELRENGTAPSPATATPATATCTPRP